MKRSSSLGQIVEVVVVVLGKMRPGGHRCVGGTMVTMTMLSRVAAPVALGRGGVTTAAAMAAVAKGRTGALQRDP
jgi:hypothetical protein